MHTPPVKDHTAVLHNNSKIHCFGPHFKAVACSSSMDVAWMLDIDDLFWVFEDARLIVYASVYDAKSNLIASASAGHDGTQVSKREAYATARCITWLLCAF